VRGLEDRCARKLAAANQIGTTAPTIETMILS